MSATNQMKVIKIHRILAGINCVRDFMERQSDIYTEFSDITN